MADEFAAGARYVVARNKDLLQNFIVGNANPGQCEELVKGYDKLIAEAAIAVGDEATQAAIEDYGLKPNQVLQLR